MAENIRVSTCHWGKNEGQLQSDGRGGAHHLSAAMYSKESVMLSICQIERVVKYIEPARTLLPNTSVQKAGLQEAFEKEHESRTC